jgi:hypothetical protein
VFRKILFPVFLLTVILFLESQAAEVRLLTNPDGSLPNSGEEILDRPTGLIWVQSIIPGGIERG